MRAVKGKTFKETALQYDTSVSTIIRRFDRIVPQTIKEKQSLPSVVAIDEFKGNAGQEKFQLIIADPVTKQPIDILPNRKKATIEAYLSEHGSDVKVVVMDMSHKLQSCRTKGYIKTGDCCGSFSFCTLYILGNGTCPYSYSKGMA